MDPRSERRHDGMLLRGIWVCCGGRDMDKEGMRVCYYEEYGGESMNICFMRNTVMDLLLGWLVGSHSDSFLL